ncbi:bifunctional 2',3'-cyclic-nucleotide 2'-phosphodiesterase/3'-nucleotidase [Stagnihabitans tardus]|uniref:Bifunctional 2',3'-cyclic-nucleotide 2'-phosphodiesterase/3'-nucleotidase n=1 Tax=Stagnihabitans tardus TaxID=2699202 RepID=A0AAE5BUE7_9RHOB|nr:bifunctional 2',3'-cyclic-nucleotide 2'-phosphodiesterase/3'-nucleotidase [Stagnihabitans tardus]NBZ86704.1 bifunctional 2',3'-cyclic-nucleotide 2'-phosphodiesterase/3'-nucleotidase [Stagnihabitans tardus]
MRTGACVRLRILATTDLHAHVMPWDYHANRASPSAGLARTASLIRKARAEVPGALLLDNGDFLNGSPMAEVPGGRNPVIAAMNHLGYDAATLGNHEFSHGLAALTEALADCRFPVVSSNMLRSRGATVAEDRCIAAPRLILRRELRDAAGRAHELRIGVLGFAPPQVVQWDSAALGAEMEVRDILEAARHHAAALRDEGADLVIALSHSGIAGSEPEPMMENATAALARLPGIDALVAGHTHLVFPQAGSPLQPGPAQPGIDPLAGTIHGKPVVMPGFFGSHLGVIDLDLERGEKGWRVKAATAGLRAIAARGPGGRLRALTRSDPEILALAAPAHQATRAWAGETVGRTLRPIHSFFAMVAPSAAVRLIALAQAEHVAQLLRGTPDQDLPVVSAAAPFHCGGRGGPQNYVHVAAGRLTRRHVFDLYPHPNAIAALRITGAGLADWLERAFSQFHTIGPGARDAELVDADFAPFNFDTIEGLTWEVDLSAPPRHDARGVMVNPGSRRICDLRWQGQALDPDQRFILATNTYRASGSGGFPVGRPQDLVIKGPTASRAILAGHISRLGALLPDAPPSWRFRPQPGASVTFDSAPGALGHIAELSAMRPEALELTPEGFRRFRLHL